MSGLEAPHFALALTNLDAFIASFTEARSLLAGIPEGLDGLDLGTEVNKVMTLLAKPGTNPLRDIGKPMARGVLAVMGDDDSAKHRWFDDTVELVLRLQAERAEQAS